jgi:glycosyltransferase involved in cell wall biosynthesis
LAEAIKRLLADKALAEKMGKEGRKRISERFSADQMVQSIDSVYCELLAERGMHIDH